MNLAYFHNSDCAAYGHGLLGPFARGNDATFWVAEADCASGFLPFPAKPP